MKPGNQWLYAFMEGPVDAGNLAIPSKAGKGRESKGLSSYVQAEERNGSSLLFTQHDPFRINYYDDAKSTPRACACFIRVWLSATSPSAKALPYTIPAISDPTKRAIS